MALFLLLAAWLMFWLGDRLVQRLKANGLDFTSLGDYVTSILYQPFFFFSVLFLAAFATAITIKILRDAIMMLFHQSDQVKYKGLGLFACAFYVAVQGYESFSKLVLSLAAIYAALHAYRLLDQILMKKRMKASLHGKRDSG